MCSEFYCLYHAWTLKVKQLPTWDVWNMHGEILPMPDKTRQALEANRKEPEYQQAKQNIINHLQNCNECRKELNEYATETADKND